MIKVIISGEANRGKSTVAILLENALQSAGISVSYKEDDLELKERSLRQVQRVLTEAESRGLNKYGIEVEIATCQLQRIDVSKEVPVCDNTECSEYDRDYKDFCMAHEDISVCSKRREY